MKLIATLPVASLLFFSPPASSQTQTLIEPGQAAWNTVQTINRHWAITENMDSLALFLHKDMMMIAPEPKERLRGREAILDSYRSYTASARTISLKELNPIVQLYLNDSLAIVTYQYDLLIESADGKKQRFTGRDMYTLVYENDEWIAVAQHFSPDPE